MTPVEELQLKIDRDAQMLQATLTLMVGNMTIAEVMKHVDDCKRLETYLEKNLLKLESLKDLEANNTKLEEF